MDGHFGGRNKIIFGEDGKKYTVEEKRLQESEKIKE